MRTVSGTTMTIKGIYELDISISNHNCPIRQIFHVVPHLTENCILGMDFIANNSVKFNGQTRKLSYKSNNNKFCLIGKISSISSKNPPTTLLENTVSPIQIEEESLLKYRDTLVSLLAANRDVVANSMSELGKAKGVKHSITTLGKPIHVPFRRIAHHLQPLITKNIEEMLLYNIIRPSNSPYSTIAVLVPKKDGERRFCIDYRKLNADTVKDKYPLPRIDVTIDYLYGAKIFSTIDLFSGYWQIEIDEADKFKTAFTTDDGHFEFNRMPFGLTNAPATFQRLMNSILRPALKKFALVYLDDIIIFSKSIEEHFVHIQKVLDLLREGGMKIKIPKCTFLKLMVKYLGHIISEIGIQPDPQKVESIKNYPIPKNVDQLRSFLGLAGYYRKFVQNYADKAHALTVLTRKDTEWKWAQEQDESFQFLKNCLLSPPILRYPNFAREFILHTDASGFGVGSVLAQMHWEAGEEKEVVIAYTSQHLNDTQMNWSTIEKEAYAIIHAVRTFYPYLYGRKFKVLTDHRPLQWLMSIKEPTGKLARWALLLQEFDIDISYRPGRINQNADCLSRIPKQDVDTQIKSPEIPMICFVTKEIETEQLNDSYCIRARQKYNRAKKLHEELSREANSDIDETIDEVLRHSRENSPNRENDQDSSSSSDDGYQEEQTRFVELFNGLIATSDGRILVPKSLREKVLKRFHSSPYAGHLGIKKTTDRIKRRFKWAKMMQDIKNYVRSCELCAKRKATGNSKAPLHPIPPPQHVWQMIAMDIVGPLTPSPEKHLYILVIGEYLTKYIITVPLFDQTADSVARAFVNNVVLLHGVPEKVLTDQGGNFQSNLMDVLYKQFGIERLRTSAY